MEGEIEMATGLTVALSVLTDGSGLAADGSDHYELGLKGRKGAVVLDAFTSLRRTAPLWRRGMLVDGGSYGRRQCIDALLAAAGEGGGTRGATASQLITAREGRNAQRLLDAVTASGGELVVVDYGE